MRNLLVISLLIFGLLFISYVSASSVDSNPKIDPALIEHIQNLDIKSGPITPSGISPLFIQITQIQMIPVIITVFGEENEDTVIDLLTQHGSKVKYKYELINAIAADVPYDYVQNLISNQYIKGLYLDKKIQIPEPDEKIEEEIKELREKGKLFPMLGVSTDTIGAPFVWNKGIDGSGVKVAVLDTGIDKNHPGLEGKIVAERDFTLFDGKLDPSDYYGHGTHCAGIIAGSGTNSTIFVDTSSTDTSGLINIPNPEITSHVGVVELDDIYHVLLVTDYGIVYLDKDGNFSSRTDQMKAFKNEHFMKYHHICSYYPSYYCYSYWTATEYLLSEIDKNGNNVTIGLDTDWDYQPDIFKGVAPGVQLLNGKVLGDYGNGFISDIIAGIEWAVLSGADVISMSLGGWENVCDGNDPLSQAVEKAWDMGTVTVIAAGNSGWLGDETVGSPGCAKKAITVGASSKYAEWIYIAYFSSKGPTSDGRIKPEVVAPGISIISARASDSNMGYIHTPYYTSASGTSMATPHVAGVVALLKEVNLNLTPDELKTYLVNGATDLKEKIFTQGAGLVNAAKSYELINGTTSMEMIITDSAYVTSDSNKTYIGTSFSLVKPVLASMDLPILLAPYNFTDMNNSKTTVTQQIVLGSQVVSYGRPGTEETPALYVTFGPSFKYNLTLLFIGGLDTSAIDSTYTIEIFNKNYKFGSITTNISLELYSSTETEKLELAHGQNVEKNDESMSQTKAYFDSSGTKINKIDIEVAPDINTYLMDGNEFVDPLFGSFRFVVNETTPSKDSMDGVSITQDGSNKIKLIFTNKDGTEYGVDVFYYDSQNSVWKRSSDGTYNFWITEANTTSNINMININDVFVVSSNQNTYVLKYASYHTSSTASLRYVTLQDVQTETKYDIYYNSDSYLRIGSEKYNVSMQDYGSSFGIAVDLNADGVLATLAGGTMGVVNITTRNQGIIQLGGNQSITVWEVPLYDITEQNEPAAGKVNVTAAWSSNDVNLAVSGVSTSQIGTSNKYSGMTSYGTMVESDTDADTVNVWYPGKRPAYANVGIEGYNWIEQNEEGSRILASPPLLNLIIQNGTRANIYLNTSLTDPSISAIRDNVQIEQITMDNDIVDSTTGFNYTFYIDDVYSFNISIKWNETYQNIVMELYGPTGYYYSGSWGYINFKSIFVNKPTIGEWRLHVFPYPYNPNAVNDTVNVTIMLKTYSAKEWNWFDYIDSELTIAPIVELSGLYSGKITLSSENEEVMIPASIIVSEPIEFKSYSSHSNFGEDICSSNMGGVPGGGGSGGGQLSVSQEEPIPPEPGMPGGGVAPAPAAGSNRIASFDGYFCNSLERMAFSFEVLDKVPYIDVYTWITNYETTSYNDIRMFLYDPSGKEYDVSDWYGSMESLYVYKPEPGNWTVVIESEYLYSLTNSGLQFSGEIRYPGMTVNPSYFYLDLKPDEILNGTINITNFLEYDFYLRPIETDIWTETPLSISPNSEIDENKTFGSFGYSYRYYNFNVTSEQLDNKLLKTEISLEIPTYLNILQLYIFDANGSLVDVATGYGGNLQEYMYLSNQYEPGIWTAVVVGGGFYDEYPFDLKLWIMDKTEWEWITIIDQSTDYFKGTRNISFTIDVPENIELKSHYATLYLQGEWYQTVNQPHDVQRGSFSSTVPFMMHIIQPWADLSINVDKEEYKPNEEVISTAHILNTGKYYYYSVVGSLMWQVTHEGTTSTISKMDNIRLFGGESINVTNNWRADVLEPGDYVLSLIYNYTDYYGKNWQAVTSTSFKVATISMTIIDEGSINISEAETSLQIKVKEPTNGSINVFKYSENPTGSTPIGIVELGKFIQIEIDQNLEDNLEWAIIKMYYNEDEVKEADEDSLRMYYWNESKNEWELIEDSGVNTNENYAWANMTHFSLYGLYGGLAPYCGDGSCDAGETCSSCPADCEPCSPSLGGGGTFGRGGSTSPSCTEDWSCIEWSECINEEHVRTCVDLNDCGTDKDKPHETQTCGPEGEVCAQVITPAVSPIGECKEFPTPCDVPEGWDTVDECPSSVKEEVTGEGPPTGMIIGLDTAIIGGILVIIVVMIGGFYWFRIRKKA